MVLWITSVFTSFFLWKDLFGIVYGLLLIFFVVLAPRIFVIGLNFIFTKVFNWLYESSDITRPFSPTYASTSLHFVFRLFYFSFLTFFSVFVVLRMLPCLLCSLCEYLTILYIGLHCILSHDISPCFNIILLLLLQMLQGVWFRWGARLLLYLWLLLFF